MYASTHVTAHPWTDTECSQLLVAYDCGGFNHVEHAPCEVLTVLSPVSLNAFAVISFCDSCICFIATAGTMSFSTSRMKSNLSPL